MNEYHDGAPDWMTQPIDVSGVVDVGELVAHKPCAGTGERRQHHHLRNGRTVEGGYVVCPGPHTVIDKGDGTKLYADKGTLRDMLLALRGQLPSEWRIE